MSFISLGSIAEGGIRLLLCSFKVPAGFPSPAADHIDKQISLDGLLSIRAPSVYLVKIDGDSMQGAGIFAGTWRLSIERWILLITMWHCSITIHYASGSVYGGSKLSSTLKTHVTLTVTSWREMSSLFGVWLCIRYEAINDLVAQTRTPKRPESRSHGR